MLTVQGDGFQNPLGFTTIALTAGKAVCPLLPEEPNPGDDTAGKRPTFIFLESGTQESSVDLTDRNTGAWSPSTAVS